MAGFFERHRNLSLLAGLCVLSFTLFALSARQKNRLTPVERAALSALSPFQNAISWCVEAAFGAWDGYIMLIGVRQENGALRERIKILTMERAQLSEKLRQYERVELLLNSGQESMGELVVAKVVGRDSGGFVRLITIDKGYSHGLKDKMPVITHLGIVGRIIMTSRSASKVMLITDVRSAVDALAQDSRDGMVAAGANGSLLTARYLTAGSAAKPGEIVVSSGLGGIFPKGLTIGRLVGVTREKDELFAKAQIAPLANLERLEEVMVMKDFSPISVDFTGSK